MAACGTKTNSWLKLKGTKGVKVKGKKRVKRKKEAMKLKTILALI